MSEEDILKLHSQRLDKQKEKLIEDYAGKLSRSPKFGCERDTFLSMWAVICAFEVYGKDYRLFYKTTFDDFTKDPYGKEIMGIIVEIHQSCMLFRNYQIMTKLKIGQDKLKRLKQNFRRQLLTDKNLDTKYKFVKEHFVKLAI